ncbi:MAG: Flp family type IVb pilin [Actinomycetota bacterium]|nr:Flp family type IVb pilin [Actinomycetota bacterium]
MFLLVCSRISGSWHRLGARAQRQDGATAVEYALMVALIAIVIIAAVAFLGNQTSAQFNHMGGCLNTPSATC